ncbi:MAG: VWA domain-containing protein [Alphaproteobacteria bacterium]|nr:VWA domain-containing protein [Alphaproteobacteria bacterium]
MITSSFFFLRPLWLLLLVPAIMFIIFAVRRQSPARNNWQKLVDPHLLKFLTVPGKANRGSYWLTAGLAAGLFAAIVAMAGPAWQKIDLPAYKSSKPVVIALSLAQSMNATDVSPSRIRRAEHKIRDILEKTKGTDTGFIIYADRPFVAVPLTTDARVIREMLPELSTDMMPVLGNRLDYAITRATNLLLEGGAHSGRIIVIADNAGSAVAKNIAAAKQAAARGFSVNVLGVGTDHGARLQTASGKAIRSRNGKFMTAKFDKKALGDIAAAGYGVFASLTPDNSDIDILLPADGITAIAAPTVKNDFHSDRWKDMGYWLLLIPLLLAPLAFRRGLLMAFPFVMAVAIFSNTPSAEASQWQDFWKTPDQQAASAFKQGDYSAAARIFSDPDWKASALYKAGKYSAAASLYDSKKSENSDFNRGNALARSGALEKAVKAYDMALKANPKDADAQFNRNLVANLLKKQKKQKKQNKKKKTPQKSGDQKDKKKNTSAGQKGKSGQKQDQSGSQKAGQQKSGNPQKSDKAGKKSDPKNGQPGKQKSNSSEQEVQQATSSQEQKAPQQNTMPKPQDSMTGKQKPTRPDQNVKGEKSIFSKAMDALLQGNGKDTARPKKQKTERASSRKTELPKLDQAVEQQLRAVPDDPSGLLKARIRQYYSRNFAAGQNQ